MIQEQLPAQRPSHCLAIVVLLVILVFAVLYGLAQFGASVGTQTRNQNQRLNNGQSFNYKPEAFVLAQTAERYRANRKPPWYGNFGLGSYTICYKDGTANRVQSSVFPGSDNDGQFPDLPENATHSEQSALVWLRRQLGTLSIDRSQIVAIYTVIFSQVKVCGPCRTDMTQWQRILREEAKTQQLYLSIWQLIPGKGGFNPKQFPKGTGTPVAINMIQEVKIAFVP